MCSRSQPCYTAAGITQTEMLTTAVAVAPFHIGYAVHENDNLIADRYSLY